MLMTTHVLLCAIVCYNVSAQTLSLNLEEGQVCKSQGSRISRCKYTYDCPTVKQNPQPTGSRPTFCNFRGQHPVICCETDVNIPPQGTKSKQMCKKYAASVFVQIPSETGNGDYSVDTCPSAVEPLIVGGVDAEPMEYPHMALVGYGSKDSKSWLCGGSLISERFVLSAAHCTKSSKGLPKWVLLGEYNKKSTADEDNGLSQPTEYEITERINHPGYQEPSLYHDITLYRLDRDVEFNEYIRPICLQTEYVVSKAYAIATGWGRTEYGGMESSALQKVNVTFQSHEKCKELYSRTADQLQNGILDASMFCAGDSDHDSCQGDSGGPLQLRLADPYCMYTQIGITSFGDACAFKSGVYTRVSHYVEWIERTVWP